MLKSSSLKKKRGLSAKTQRSSGSSYATSLDDSTSGFGNFTPSGWAKEQRAGGTKVRAIWDDDAAAETSSLEAELSASPQERVRKSTKLMTLSELMAHTTEGKEAAPRTRSKANLITSANSVRHARSPQRPAESGREDGYAPRRPLRAQSVRSRAASERGEYPELPSLPQYLREESEYLQQELDASGSSSSSSSVPQPLPEVDAAYYADELSFAPSLEDEEAQAEQRAAEVDADEWGLDYETGPVPRAWRRKNKRRSRYEAISLDETGAGADDFVSAFSSYTTHDAIEHDAVSDDAAPAGAGTGMRSRSRYSRARRGYQRAARADSVAADGSASGSSSGATGARRGQGSRARAGAEAGLDDNVEHAVNEMVRLLTQREYGAAELKSKCLRKFTLGAVSSALAICQERGYQSEERYGQMLVRHMEFSLYGPLRLQQVARRKEVSWELLQTLSSEVDWEQLAYEALLKKYGLVCLDYPAQRKALAYVARRGFSASTCISALRRLQVEAREAD